MSASRHQDWDAAASGEVIAAHAGQQGALLPILHALQARFGWIRDEDVPLIAQVLNLSRAEVHGVLTFYHDFRRSPPGRHVLKLCQAEACQARGSRDVTAHAEQKLGVAIGETTADGRVSFEPIYCLGLCASGPAALVDGVPVARLGVEAMDRLLDGALT